jgi:thiamine transport system ATP-binding protein
MSRLLVTGVTVRFEATTVLDDVSLSVADGETVALLGPSGSGKSTLLRVIAGLLTPDAGGVTIDDVDITGLATHRRGVGMVFQDEQLFPHRDVGENVAFGLRMAGVDATTRTARVDEMLALVGLSGFGRRRVTDLSGGEAKRVALARALAPTPRVLLLDEPLTGLDADLHDRLALDLHSVLRSTGTTAVHVTHDRAEADVVADRVVTLDSLRSSTSSAGPFPTPTDR